MNSYLIATVVIVSIILSVSTAYFFSITGYFSKIPADKQTALDDNQTNIDSLSQNQSQENGERTSLPQTEQTGGENATNSTLANSTKQYISARINEIMYNTAGSDEGKEWVELYNNGTADINLTSWKFFEGNTSHRINLFRGSSVISKGSYAVITTNGTVFSSTYTSFNSSVFTASFSLSNTGEYIAMIDDTGKIADSVYYNSSSGGNGNGMSIEFHDYGWSESSVNGGAPGRLNSIPATITTTNSTTSTTVTNLCQNVLCVNTTQICEDGFIANCTPLCNNSTGVCGSCTPDCSGHEILITVNAFNTSQVQNSTTNFTNTTENNSSTNLTNTTENNTSQTSANQTSSNVTSSSLNHVTINEFTTRGPGGTYDEFVELYNPTDAAINITSWKLQYKSATGTSWDSKVGSGLTGSINARGFYLLASKNYSSATVPDYRHSATWGFADSGGHIRIIDASGLAIDKVGYGNAIDPEGSPAPSPGDGKSLQRKSLTSDTDNNLDDFVISNNPSLQNSTNQ